MQMRIAVAEKSHFEVVEERHQPRLRVDDRRHHDKSSVSGPDASAHPELWKLTRWDLCRDDEIEQADDELAERQATTSATSQSPAVVRAVPGGVVEKARDAGPDRDGDHPEIPDRRVPEDKTGEPLAQLRPVSDFLLETEAAARNQIVADVMPPIVARLVVLRRRGRARSPSLAMSVSEPGARFATCSIEWR